MPHMPHKTHNHTHTELLNESRHFLWRSSLAALQSPAFCLLPAGTDVPSPRRDGTRLAWPGPTRNTREDRLLDVLDECVLFADMAPEHTAGRSSVRACHPSSLPLFFSSSRCLADNRTSLLLFQRAAMGGDWTLGRCVSPWSPQTPRIPGRGKDHSLILFCL